MTRGERLFSVQFEREAAEFIQEVEQLSNSDHSIIKFNILLGQIVPKKTY